MYAKLADTNSDARDGYSWVPGNEQLERANVVRLARSLGCDDYASLHRVSIEEPDRFWRAVREDLQIPLARDWDAVLDDSRGIEWTTWFEGARLNLAHACVHHWAAERPDALAAVFQGEDGARDEWTFAALSLQVVQLAEALAALGVVAGDRVAMYMPMCPEVAVASHACAHIGAVQVPIFSGFAAPAIVQRLRDSEAKVVITADYSLRRGSRISMRETIDETVRESPSVEHVVEWSRENRAWNVELGPGEMPALEVASESPYLLAYTSGTTGKPKGALHVQGGFLLSIAREAAYQSDLKRDDRVLFATDMGWIMGPWTVVGAGAAGAAVVYMEGAPDWPADRIWRIVESERVTMLGVSPTLIRALIPKGEPAADLSSLRSVTTTGEPWNRGPYDWLNEHVCGGGRIPIVNISGGTEVGACFLGVTMMAPTKPCSLGFSALGQDMDILDDVGRPVRGEVGELVCRRAWPGMTRGLWRDRERYLETYWERFPGVWTHGDWASVDEDGYWFLHGRSDDTLNIAGKRIGPAELESAAVNHPAVTEAAAIGVPHEVKGEVPWLFCVLRPGEDASSEDVARAVTDELGKSFKPERVLFVSALPKTRSAKIVRRAVRATALGEEPGDLSTLENPESLEEIARVV
ncbi:MAG: AMP-binding protein [Actinobacteria bacterium]|nr:AMP-binding protein [Actinomycetota bacterium]MBA3561764.1 AMP-binding protein [Actinomycetota bacterium]MBA3567053.1 AMP-binding protein [Actinomycetota bacterium]